MSALAAGPYVRVLRTPGALRLVVSYLATGIAMAMLPVAFVLFARGVTGSFASASLVLAANTAGTLVFAPLRGRLVDRLGPTRVLLLMAAPSLAADAGLIVAGQLGAAAAALVGIAFVAGAALPPVGSSFRLVFGEMIVAGGDEHTGFALLSMIGEISFLTGPLLAGALIALGSTTLSVAVAAALSSLGAIAFATAPASRAHGPGEVTHTGLRPPGGPGMRTILGASALFGATFGLLDVAYPAFATEHGAPASAGILLAGIALGIGTGSYLFGLRRRDREPTVRLYPLFSALAALGLAPLLAADAIGALALLSVLCGLCFAPLTVTGNMAIESFAPRSRAEAFSWLVTLYGSGAALGAALAGQLVEGEGPRAAILAACAAMLVATAFTAARTRTLR